MECTFDNPETETPRQTFKRKYSELNQLYDALRCEDEDQALQTLRRIRAGQPIETILEDSQLQSSPVASEQRRRRSFLIALVQTTASLPHIVRMASWVLLDPSLIVRLPENAAYTELRDCVVNLDTLTTVLAEINPDQSRWAIKSSNNAICPRVADGFNGGPPHWAPAAPWTSVIRSSEAVSHLVSVYLALVNGYWRFVEQDYFLRAMRRGTPSEYCTPFLVNAILACASVCHSFLGRSCKTDIQKLFSETEEAFFSSSELLTRGEHFHQEATRLWAMETGQPTIANIQALFIMSMQ